MGKYIFVWWNATRRAARGSVHFAYAEQARLSPRRMSGNLLSSTATRRRSLGREVLFPHFRSFQKSYTLIIARLPILVK